MAVPTEASPLLNRPPDAVEVEGAHRQDEHGELSSRQRSANQLGLPFGTTLIGMVAFFTLLMLEWRFEVIHSNTVNFQLLKPRSSPQSPQRTSSIVPSNGLQFWSSHSPPQLLGSKRSSHKKNKEHKVAEDGVNVSFAELGVSLIQQYYADSLEVIDTVFVEGVQPEEVALPRKTLLKTRDLLDIFSPIYPATNAKHAKKTKHKSKKSIDLWTELRWEIAKGYQIVGEFLDLNHAHINYTQASCDELRQEVLDWKSSFTHFRQKHPDIPLFLSKPLVKSGQVHHAKESRFFWQDTPKELLPIGSSPVTPIMQTLGIHQANLALDYLNRTMSFQRIVASHSPEEQLKRQETFHNLRKNFRSMCDEVEVMGADVFLNRENSAVSLDAQWALLVKARGILGDMNDMWTAFDYYIEHDMLYLEQDRLALAIDTAFLSFKQWALEVDLDGVLRYMIQVMMMGSSSIVDNHDDTHDTSGDRYQRKLKSLPAFLKLAKKYPTHSIVIGNQAGDADSVISAISLAYIETYAPATPRIPRARKTPIVSITKHDLDQLRPEIVLLLQLAGIAEPAKELLFVDSKPFKKHMQVAEVTLVDHNAIEGRFRRRKWNWHVVEILDHHQDERLYLDASPRVIAFDENHGGALVASACTLVAERMLSLWEPPYPAPVSLLLLGVILLDSVNLSPQAGKVTQRDIEAIQKLLDNVDWLELPRASQWAVGMRDNGTKTYPDTNTTFQLLQEAKYSHSFWGAISVHDALRYDYKDFGYENGIFGIASVLMPMDDFIHKRDLMPDISRFMEENGINFLGIMFAYEQNDQLRRELMLCSNEASSFEMSELEDHLLDSSLQLKEIRGVSDDLDEKDGLNLRFFLQENVKASRKQIGPILQESLNNILTFRRR